MKMRFYSLKGKGVLKMRSCDCFCLVWNHFFRFPRRLLWSLFLLLLGVLSAAWGFELIGGYMPCGLCLFERIPYYVALPLTAALFFISSVRFSQVMAAGICLVLIVSMGLGGYHAGVEWGFWEGPSSCGIGGALSYGLPDLTKPLVQCTVAPWRFLGLSFAGWNGFFSALGAFLAGGYGWALGEGRK